MQRRHFEIVAAALATAYASASDAERRGVYASASELAALLAQTNPAFDRERFMRAALPA